VNGGTVIVMQLMEHTSATAMSFRPTGVWRFESNSDGGEVTVGAEQS
jgi:hypothetical protein